MAKTRVVLFNKPYGVLTQFTSEPGRPNLSRFGLPAGVYPAGRLDHDSEGLLLLTDDGGLIRRLTDPRHHTPKTYWAQVERVPGDEALKRLAGGLMLADGRAKPCKVRRLDPEPAVPPRDPPIRVRLSVPTAWLELTLTEGRNRQVRRMTAAIEHPTLRLLRVGIGRLGIQGLEPGKWRWVQPGEL